MDHSTLIDQILNVERTARALSDEALERQAHLDETLAQEQARIMESYMARAAENLKKLEQNQQESKARAIAAQDARLAEANRKMERTYARYGENWVDTLFHQVVDLP